MQAAAQITDRPVEPVILRRARADERRLIASQWLANYQHSRFGQQFSPGLFERRWRSIVEACLGRGEAIVLCPADSPDATVYGWRVSETRPGATILHYVFVRGSSRRLGYARQLLAGLPEERLVASHRTMEGQRVAERIFGDRVIFDLTAV